MSTLLEQVATNLTHYNKWTEVDSRDGFLHGIPPTRLDSNDEPNLKEWVVPRSILDDAKLHLQEIDNWFNKIATWERRPKRITVGLVNSDGTVVYYFVHDGIVKPRQN